MSLRWYFKALIGQHESLKLFRQAYAFADMLLQSIDTVVPYHKPELERTESLAQRDLPVLERSSSKENNCSFEHLKSIRE